MRSHWAVRVVIGLSVLGILVGLLMWAQADSGTKAVDLGSGLVATGLFGLLFIVWVPETPSCLVTRRFGTRG